MILWGLILVATARAEKVAIVVASGIENGAAGVNQTFKENRELGQKTYAAAGYRVITLGQGQGPAATAENLRTELGRLEGVTDLQLSFIGHGDLTNLATPTQGESFGLDPKRFPPVQFRGEDPQIHGVDPSRPIQFFMRDDYGDPESFIGVGDIRQGLDTARSRNPNLKTTVVAANCFGGNLTRDLNDVPGLQAFAGAERDQAARVLKNSGPSADFSGMLVRELGKGQTYQAAYEEAQRRFIEGSLVTDSSNPSLSGLPRTQSLELIHAWCVKNHRGTEAAGACVDCAAPTAARQAARKLAIDVAKRGPTGARDQITKIQNDSICGSDRAAARAFVTSALAKLNAAAWSPLIFDFPPGGPTSTEAAKQRQRVAERCTGGQESLPGEHYAMSLGKVRALFDGVFKCIDESEIHAIPKGYLGNKLRLFLESQLSGEACHWMKSRIDRFEQDLECADDFAKQAGDKDWDRLLELTALSGRTLVSTGGAK